MWISIFTPFNSSYEADINNTVSVWIYFQVPKAGGWGTLPLLGSYYFVILGLTICTFISGQTCQGESTQIQIILCCQVKAVQVSWAANSRNLSHRLQYYGHISSSFWTIMQDIPERLERTLWKSNGCTLSVICLLKCSNILVHMGPSGKKQHWALLDITASWL